MTKDVARGRGVPAVHASVRIVSAVLNRQQRRTLPSSSTKDPQRGVVRAFGAVPVVLEVLSVWRVSMCTYD